jgi:hypothetical protein
MPDLWPLPIPVERKETPHQETQVQEPTEAGTLDLIGALIIHLVGKILFP